MLKALVSAKTDVGVKRSHNEDWIVQDQELGLYIVCDGMGGHAAGEVASQHVCQSLMKYFRNKEYELKETEQHPDKIKLLKELVREGVMLANAELFSLAQNDPTRQGMGTTLVMGLVRNRDAVIAHVGDSRAYISRSNELHQITEDHSLVNEMVKNGIVSKDKAHGHPQANVITKAMGIHKLVIPDIISLELMPQDRLLLCSDGLYEYFSQEQLKHFLKELGDIDKINQRFIDMANDRGGKDNISSILVQFEQSDDCQQEYVSVERKIETLKRIPLFKSMSYKELSKVLELIKVERYSKGSDIVIENQPGGDMFVILKGQANVLNEEIQISELPAGGYFGEMSLIDKNPRSATVRASEEMKVMRIPRDELLELLKEEPKIGVKLFWAFLHNMNRRLRENDKRLFEFQKKLSELSDSTPESSLGFSLDF